jgi:hypothetical protein
MMAGVNAVYVDRSKKTMHFNEESSNFTCSKCTYLEKNLQVVLSELNSMKMAVKLLYDDSNMVVSLSEVRPRQLPSYDEVISSAVWQSIKPSHYKMRNGVGEIEVSQTNEPMLNTNRYDVLSDLSEYEHSVQSPGINGTTDLVI